VGKLKNNQKGFSAVETLMAIVIIALIVGAGWLVHSHAKTNKTTTTTTKTSSTNTNTSDPKGPSQSQYNGWLSFCSSYGGLCLKYPANWKLTQAAYAPGQSATGQEVDTITSPSTNVTVTYMPSAQVTGSRRIENIKVVGVTSTDITQLKVIKLIDQITSPSSQYAVEDYVTLTSAAHALNTANTPFTPGATIANTSEPPYHQFTNPQRPGNIGQQLLAVTVANGDPGSNFFTSNANAQTWLSSSEVQTAGQILDSVTYSQ
jgi:prepilin-type N-terminal cleavage/methylation domain-containing protein